MKNSKFFVLFVWACFAGLFLGTVLRKNQNPRVPHGATIVRNLVAGRAVSLEEFYAAFPSGARPATIEQVAKELSVPVEDVRQIISDKLVITYHGAIPASLRPTTAPATQPVAVEK